MLSSPIRISNARLPVSVEHPFSLPSGFRTPICAAISLQSIAIVAALAVLTNDRRLAGWVLGGGVVGDASPTRFWGQNGDLYVWPAIHAQQPHALRWVARLIPSCHRNRCQSSQNIHIPSLWVYASTRFQEDRYG